MCWIVRAGPLSSEDQSSGLSAVLLTLPYFLVMHLKRRRVQRKRHGNDEGSSPRYFDVLLSGSGC